jgi:hypothetical protein
MIFAKKTKQQKRFAKQAKAFIIIIFLIFAHVVVCCQHPIKCISFCVVGI